MSTQEPSRSADGASPIRRTRSANDLDTLSRNSLPVQAAVSENGAESSGRPLEGEGSSTTILPTTQNSSGGPSGATLALNLPMDSRDPPTLVQNGPAVAPSPQTAGEGRLHQFLSSMGIGRGATAARKSQFSLVCNLCWGFTQIAIIVTLVILSGTVWKNPQYPQETEWAACDRPLGVWACLWAGRVVLASVLAYWDYKRSIARAALQPDAQSSTDNPPQASPSQDVFVFHPRTHETPGNGGSNNQDPEPVNLPHTLLYSRLTLFSSLITLSWFLTAHILQYTSLNTCRHTSPHIWWLTFGILCIMYLMVLEVLLLGFIVLVVAPILFVFWNIFLFCIGRHPAQNPHMIKPDIGKLPKSLVDRIPLVMYIPPPPAPATTVEAGKEAEPTPSHEYPPKSPSVQQEPSTSPPLRSTRFAFFRRKRSAKEAVSTAEASGGDADVDLEKGKLEQETWEEQYEKGDYPFVVLEGNRAACAICLMDFEPPRRKDENAPTEGPTPVDNSPPSVQSPSNDEQDNPLRLEASGEGAQPLRLLACGHVFHQTCLDPWLTDVSGRCPVCQRRVEVTELKKRKRRQR